MILYPHLDVNERGHLTIGGMDTVDLAKAHGTPLYLYDESVIRHHIRTYLSAAAEHFGRDALPLFASKAFCCKEIYRIAAEEGIGIDCVSSGELFTANAADFPAERIYFHGNNKTDADIRRALDMGVGTFVVDNKEELLALDALAESYGKVQRILLRITPGIDPHTHAKITTGNVDSKFGSAIVTGQAMEIVKEALARKHVSLAGIHCHIGSQIFTIEPFTDAASIMIAFLGEIRRETGVTLDELSLGGGFGVRYTEFDPEIDYREAIGNMAKVIRRYAESEKFPMPRIVLEPGRSIVAAAGITLYTVGSVKEIPGFRSYVSVDGGMPDNPRYALYQSQYTTVVADRAAEKADYRATLAGRCCESGDLLGENMPIQRPRRGDTLAVLVTGAYNYAMASNYNKIPRPPVVFVKDGEARTVVRRESLEDLLRNDL